MSQTVIVVVDQRPMDRGCGLFGSLERRIERIKQDIKE